MVAVERDLKQNTQAIQEMKDEVSSINNRLSNLEQGMYRLERIEKRQGKTADRLEVLEVDVGILQEKLMD